MRNKTSISNVMQNKSNTDMSQNGYYLMKNIRQLPCKKNCFGLMEHGSMEKYLKITADFLILKKTITKFYSNFWKVYDSEGK